MKMIGKILKIIISFPFNIIVGMLILAAIYHFFLFFAYDLNPNYLKIHECKQVDGVWDGSANRCSLRVQ